MISSLRFSSTAAERMSMMSRLGLEGACSGAGSVAAWGVEWAPPGTTLDSVDTAMVEGTCTAQWING